MKLQRVRRDRDQCAWIEHLDKAPPVGWEWIADVLLATPKPSAVACC
ncbi:MAG: hypothetical protein ING71_13980 [Rhodocyclaceae bacterium]|nr:hypothetical protein [Rhodocyclaceae bacterium]MCA3061568.1 hypothetical protein [Rhodocyclaceae bacterium]MCA3061982.1 hypothetical protein [Rhodocyclaceae bacterium]MCA3079887.1 hypothetical protein [Rhodocyclaceae bacterium]